MSGKIYLVADDGELLSMKEQPYEAESLLQKLLAKYPDLLAGDQMRPGSPRRWLLVSRELAVPEDESETGRWSLDHLFIDQEGVPTLVEVKRSSNTQIRREVVGQMLDYAANGTAYWSLGQITAAFELRCERDGVEAGEVLGSFLGSDSEWSEEEFWQAVKTNMQAGRVRLVFVADRIPAELRRIIEFLNEQMDPAEVVGVEVPQFVGESQQALVPRVVGVTAEAERRKTVGRSDRRRWDRDSFVAALAAERPEADVAAAEQILSWADDRELELIWGTGKSVGSFSPKTRVGDDLGHLFSVYTDFNVRFFFGAMRLAPFDEFGGRRELADRLEGMFSNLRLSDPQLEKAPFLGHGRLTTPEQVEAFLSVWDWYISEVTATATD